VAVAGASALAAILWASSPFLRLRVTESFKEWQTYQFDRADNPVTSGGLRLEFWKKSFTFISEAPILGHGTGSLGEKFREVAAGTGVSASQSDNPHNQFFAVAIPLGLAGGALLIAMWIAHLALFRGGGTVAWVGLVIVLQNIVSSQFNSHIFDFLHGWLYVFGVGVVGGMALRAAAKPPPTEEAREAR
jgi:O-antigen ligase